MQSMTVERAVDVGRVSMAFECGQDIYLYIYKNTHNYCTARNK